jgi:predicted dehydrogenase
MTKILFIGLGSAGQRHLRILIKLLGRKNTEFFCYRSTNRNMVINDKLKTRKVKSLEEYYKIKNVSLNELVKYKFDIVYISNPIYRHMYFALRFAKLGAHIFIEKPISHNLKNVGLLKQVAKRNKVKICVGYQLRFHPGIQYIKKIIKKKKLGKLLSGNFHFGEYLPLMHKYEDYTQTHMAKKSEGGGAVLCLSHQVDLLRYLLGEPKILSSSIKKLSNLKIDVEDNLNAKLKYERNAMVNLKVNFIDNPPKFFINLNFEQGKITWDYIDNCAFYVNNKSNKKTILKFKKFKRNHMFIDQAKNFLASIKNNKKLMSDLDEGMKTLKLCVLLKKNGIKK